MKKTQRILVFISFIIFTNICHDKFSCVTLELVECLNEESEKKKKKKKKNKK